MTRRVTGRAFARAGLLGNPSDAYGGKAIALALRDFSARVIIEPALHFEAHLGEREAAAPWRAADLREALADLGPDADPALDPAAGGGEPTSGHAQPTGGHAQPTSGHAQPTGGHAQPTGGHARPAGCRGSHGLLRASVKRFAQHAGGSAAACETLAGRGDAARLRFRMSVESNVPFQIGLAGSSAIVIATLRALAAWFAVEIAPFDLAELALAAEVEDLGIAAGPMDRVVQAYGGLLALDFRGPRRPECYRQLPPEALPPLYIAWDPHGGKASGEVHADVRRRWEGGDPVVCRAMQQIAGLVDAGIESLETGDHAALRALANRNFELRAALFPIAERDRSMVEIGRARGAGVKLCGSGGAVVGILPAASEPGTDEITRAAHSFETLRADYRRAGFEALRPQVAPA